MCNTSHGVDGRSRRAHHLVVSQESVQGFASVVSACFMPQTLFEWFVVVLVVCAGVLISRWVVWLFMSDFLAPHKVAAKRLWDLEFTEEQKKDWKRKNIGVQLQPWVGAIEIIPYAFSIVVEHPEFIAVWFATKYIAVWRNWGEDPAARTFYNRGLFGSGLNILLGFATGQVALWVIGSI